MCETTVEGEANNSTQKKVKVYLTTFTFYLDI